MATAEPIIMPGYQGEAIHGPYDDPDDPDGERYERRMCEYLGGASVEQAFELFSAAAPEGWRVELVEGEICVVPPAHDYAKSVKRKLGLTVPLPVPLGFELDTAEF